MDSFEMIDVRREGRLAWITLNRPQKLNALNHRLLGELDEALEGERRSDSRVLVLRGAGRAFSAGYDISGDSEEMSGSRDSVGDREHLARYIEHYLRLWDHPKPVIAAVHGYCMAGATQMCVFCDLTVVAEDAVIAASPAVPVGGGFISPLWTSLVGPKRAKHMSFVANNRISGATAAEWGWANFAVPPDQLESRVRELALEIAKTPSSLLRMKKLAVNRVMELQGFRTAAFMGADTDALLHETTAVRATQESIREHGLKETIRRFDAGEI